MRLVGVLQRDESVDIALAPLRLPYAFEQQMILDEREIKGRIAERGAFGVQDHGTLWSQQNVLRAEIAVDERPLVRARRVQQRRKPAGKIAMRAAGRD